MSPKKNHQNDSFESFEQFEQHGSVDSKPVINNSFELESSRTRDSTASRFKQVTEPIFLSEQEWRKKVRTHAINCLARREYSRAELRKKVIASLHGFMCISATPPHPHSDDADNHHHDTERSEAIIDQVLDELAQGQWQSDQRVAASVAKVKSERYGSARVKHELSRHGLDNDLIQHELAQLANTELQRAHAVWQKKFGTTPKDLKEKAKQVRFMASRGFGFDIINKIIKNADDYS